MRTFQLLFLFLVLPCLAFGQSVISDRVQKEGSKTSKASFSVVERVSVSLKNAGIDEAFLEQGIILELNEQGISDLQKTAPAVLGLTLPLPGIGDANMTLIPNKVLADGFILRDGNDQIIDYKPGLYYQGTLDNDANSLVAISVFDNEIHGVIATDHGNFVIGKLENNAQGRHIIYNDLDYQQPSELDCGTDDDNKGYTEEELSWDETKSVGDCIRVYVEIDDDIVSNKGGATGATNYVTGVFNESITLYANDGLAMSVSEIKAWTTPAPYSGSSSSAMLSSYQANTGAFNGDLSHLVSYQASGGIAAGFAGICNSNVDNSKCFSSISSSYSTVPTYSFTVMVVTHEMGHLIGSRHTHACVWNGNNTAIDGCAGGTEGGCGLPGSPSSGGTIMSYCHLTTGIDFTQGFGPQPGNVIRNTIANSTCTSSCGPVGPTCFDGVQNGDETGIDCGGSCTACPEPCTDNEVTVSITLDNYPEETSWNITNASGSVVASGGTYGSSPDGSTVSVTECLPNGCYDFTINDTYGDGICCAYGNGSYSVTGPGGSLASGGSFTSSETTNFCFGSGPAPTCTDGIQNGSEEGVDCGGSCAPCATCNDGIQNGNEDGVDCGGSCAPCATCNDGIQNGDETGVDCGGSCAPCATGGEIFGSYFESGWDGWQDGGSDCARYAGSFSYEGSYSIRIRDNSGTASAMTSPVVNASGLSSMSLTFIFYPNSMENGEDFFVRYYNGSSWSTIAAYAAGSSFTNGSFYSATVTVNSSQVNFASNSQFRLQCDASGNNDQIYVDAVVLTGSSSGFVADGPIVADITELGKGPVVTTDATEGLEHSLGIETIDATEVTIFPNPATNQLNIRAGADMASIRIISATGQVVSQQKVAGDHHRIDISTLKPGIYYLMVEVNGELKPQRFVKQ